MTNLSDMGSRLRTILDNFLTIRSVQQTNRIVNGSEGKTIQEPDFEFETAPTRVDSVKDSFIDWTALTVPFALGCLLAISNGYFFSGFQPFSLTNIPVMIAWGSGIAIEAAGLAALFYSARSLKQGHRKNFRYGLAGAIVLASISLLAQYVYLQMEYQSGSIAVNDRAIDTVPIFSVLVGINGFQGHDLLFLVRALAYHIAEFVCTFLITRKGVTVQVALQRQREIFDYKSQKSTQDMILSLSASVQASMTALVEQQKTLLETSMAQVRGQIAARSTITPIPEPPIQQVAGEPVEDFQPALLNQRQQQSRATEPLNQRS